MGSLLQMNSYLIPIRRITDNDNNKTDILISYSALIVVDNRTYLY